MKWCRFSTGGPISYGIIEGETVTEVDGTPFDSYTKTSNTHKLDAVKLEVPVIPLTFYAAGINYPEHVTWAAQMRGEEPVLPTQAGHDAGILSAAGIPTAMLFVRNPTGVSHSPDEHAEVPDCLAGVDALAETLTRLVS
nr:M20/M25/M40 family metallo-hydrolase [Alteromonas macleodii]